MRRVDPEPELWWTTDPTEVQQWAARRNAEPIFVPMSRHPIEMGELSLRLPGEEVGMVFWQLDWSEWCEVFEQRKLCFVCGLCEPDGSLSTDFHLARRPPV